MSDGQKPNEAVDTRPMWRTPVIDQDSIADSTRAYFPVGYGS